MLDLIALHLSAVRGTPYDPSCGLTEAAYKALARATEVRETCCLIGGEVHGLVQRKDGLHVLAVGENDPGGPIDPDLAAR